MGQFDQIGTLWRHSKRRKANSTPRDRQAVCEAAKLVFCVYSGIPLVAVRISSSQVQVKYDNREAFRREATIPGFLEMIMAGPMGLQRLLGNENLLFEEGISEARQLFDLASKTNKRPGDFDAMLSRSCKRVLASLADPKFRAAIAAVTRVFMRERADIDAQRLNSLIQHVRAKLAG